MSSTTKLFAGLATLAVVTTTTTGLRILARRRSSVPLGADDYWIVASLFIMFGMLADGGVRRLGRPFIHVTI